MKSQDKTAIRELPMSELKLRLHECDEKIFKLKFANSISPVKNPLEIRSLKKQKAQISTWIRQQEIKMGASVAK